MSIWSRITRRRGRARDGPRLGPARLTRAVRLLADVAELPPDRTDLALSYVRGLSGGGVADAPEPESGSSAEPRPDQQVPAQVDVRLLGRFEVRFGDLPVRAWGGGRIRTVLQYLLLHDRPVHREVLMELLWPGHTYQSARNNLNVCLYGLRQALDAGGGRDCVLYRDGCYRLNDDLDWSVDAARFERAADRGRAAAARGHTAVAIEQFRAALDEYAGPLLAGEPASEWFADLREAFADRFARTLQRLAELDLSIGDVAGAELAARRLLREDPCREVGHRLLMTCYARQNQLDQVARQFRRCAERLRDDLEVAPSAETVRVYRELTALRA